MGLFEKLKQGLFKTAQQLAGSLEPILKGQAKVPETVLKDLEERLIAADMGAETAQSILKDVRESLAKEREVGPEVFLKHLRQAIFARFPAQNPAWKLANPVVILLIGVNGAGKTTTAGKLASRFSLEGRKVLLAAGDTFRAAAEEQLTMWAKRAKVELVRGAHGAAPSAVVFDALKSGIAGGFDCLIVDTAGRLHNRLNLMEELKKIVRVAEKASPGIAQEKWLVLDANTGQNALAQAREFGKETGLTGLVLTKVDGTAKGGVVVALSQQMGIPVRFLGVGEGAEDLVPFDPQMFVEALVPDSAVNV